MRTMQLAVAGLVIAAVTACGDFHVPNYNNESLDALVNDPNPTRVATATQGLIVATRAGIAEYMLNTGVQGRETYVLTPETPGSVTERLVGPLTPAAPGGVQWSNQYTAIRQGNTILAALDAVQGMTDPDKEATRGFVKAMMAYEYLIVVSQTDVGGAALDVDNDDLSTQAAILGGTAGRDAVLTRVRQLLDESYTHLAAGGTTFPFRLPAGFTGFNTPATFRPFNRALRARADVYLGDWAGAITDLGVSFISTTAPLSLGVYHNYSTGSGDLSNSDYDPGPRAFFGHPAIPLEGQLRNDGSKDLRIQNKTFTRAQGPFTFSGVTTDVGLRVYAGPDAAIPFIRNEELILLRAEANMNLTNTSTAIQDINLIRNLSGGLDPISDPYVPGAGQPATLLDELAYERRYSLLFEGHRWVDMRRWGKLAELPKAATNHRIFSRMPIPDAECQPRNPKPSPGCDPETGI